MPRDPGAVQDEAAQVAGVADVAEDDGPAPVEDGDDGVPGRACVALDVCVAKRG